MNLESEDAFTSMRLAASTASSTASTASPARIQSSSSGWSVLASLNSCNSTTVAPKRAMPAKARKGRRPSPRHAARSASAGSVPAPPGRVSSNARAAADRAGTAVWSAACSMAGSSDAANTARSDTTLAMTTHSNACLPSKAHRRSPHSRMKTAEVVIRSFASRKRAGSRTPAAAHPKTRAVPSAVQAPAARAKGVRR